MPSREPRNKVAWYAGKPGRPYRTALSAYGLCGSANRHFTRANDVVEQKTAATQPAKSTASLLLTVSVPV